MIKEGVRNFKINDLTFLVYKHLGLRLAIYNKGSGKKNKHIKNNLMYININAS
jgi:hypothetical protein